MYRSAIERCQSAGLLQYEVSSFAAADMQCRHNLAYWLGNPWLGFGPSAAGFVDGVRATSHPSTTTWIKRMLAGESTIYLQESLTPEQAALERLVFGIRMVRGVDLDALKEITGVDLELIVGEQLSEFERLGLLERNGSQISLTARGRMVADGVSEKLLSK